MRIRNLLFALLIGGCASHTYLAAEAPPPPRGEVVVYKPGYVWIQGHWARTGNHWAWVHGRHERERPGYVYINGHWDRRAQGYVWIDGQWRQQSSVVVRRQYE